LDSSVVKSGRSVETAMLVGWLVPGAGHVLMGRPLKGVLLFVLIVGLFAGGLAQRANMEWIPSDIVSKVCFIVRLGGGLQAVLAFVPKVAVGDLDYVYSEVGGVFTTVAGGLNILAVFSLLDLAGGRGSARGAEGAGAERRREGGAG
jgi:hypothetical protein